MISSQCHWPRLFFSTLLTNFVWCLNGCFGSSFPVIAHMGCQCVFYCHAVRVGVSNTQEIAEETCTHWKPEAVHLDMQQFRLTSLHILWNTINIARNHIQFVFYIHFVSNHVRYHFLLQSLYIHQHCNTNYEEIMTTFISSVAR